jgi:hypothetical protein
MDVEEKKYHDLAGDPDHLQTMAQHYLNIADAIRKSVPALQAIHDEGQNQSQATDKLKDDAGDLADDISKAESRYRVTAQALLDYVPALRHAQADAHTAAVQIAHYTTEVSTTASALTKANTAVDEADDAGKDDASSTQKTAQKAASDAKSDLATWQKKWEDAANDRDTAAETAKSKIVDVVQHHNNGLKNPTHHWYDGITHFAGSVWHAVKSAGKWVASHLEEICKWAGVLAIFLSWVPILGEVLIGLAILGSLITLGKDIAAGKGWKTLLADSVGVVLTAFGSGIFKYAGKLGKFDRAVSALSKEKGAGAFIKPGLFTRRFGVTKQAFSSGEELGTKMVAPGMKNFLKDVRNPFPFEVTKGLGIKGNIMANLAKAGEKGEEFVKSAGGLNILKLRNLGKFDEFSELSTGYKVVLAIGDGRKVLTNIEKLTNTTSDLTNGDYGLHGDKSPQITLKPEKILIDHLPDHLPTLPTVMPAGGMR